MGGAGDACVRDVMVLVVVVQLVLLACGLAGRSDAYKEAFGKLVIVCDGRSRVGWGTNAFASRRTCLGRSPPRHNSHKGHTGRRCGGVVVMVLVCYSLSMLLLLDWSNMQSTSCTDGCAACSTGGRGQVDGLSRRFERPSGCAPHVGFRAIRATRRGAMAHF